ncbi:hypothetical protein [Larkinella sp.]|uniref:hypothetical protein n=1 Tax=Larkinella sp. TaxID=2034517 RepID=UPI003BA88708
MALIVIIFVAIGVISVIAFLILLYKSAKLKLTEPQKIFNFSIEEEKPFDQYPILYDTTYAKKKYSGPKFLLLNENYNEYYIPAQNQHLISLFGSPSAGKSSLIASMLYYMHEDLNLTINDSNLEKKFETIFEKISHNQYQLNKIDQEFRLLNLKLKPKKKHSSSIDMLLSNFEELNLSTLKRTNKSFSFMSNFFDWNPKSTHLLFTFDYLTMSEEDKAVYNFLNFYNSKVSNRITKIIIIIIVDSESYIENFDIEELIKNKIPLTYEFSKWNDQFSMFSFLFYPFENKINQTDSINLPAAKKLIGKIYKDITDTNIN